MERRQRQEAFPTRALLARLNSRIDSNPWHSYLPDSLRPEGIVARFPQSVGAGPLPTLLSSKPSTFEGRGNKLERRKDADSNISAGSSEKVVTSFSEPDVIKGHVWELSQDSLGCRQVQKALDDALSYEDRFALMCELKTHVWEAMRSPHANHVLQKAVSTLDSKDCQFMIDELIQDDLVSVAARHKYGCRVVQRLMDHCKPEQVAHVNQTLAADAVQISCHPYGNYVIQHLLLHGTTDQIQCACSLIFSSLKEMCSDPFGCSVISAVMVHAPEDDRLRLARLLVEDRPILFHIACSRHGQPAIRAALELLPEQERASVVEVLLANVSTLSASRYRRLILPQLQESSSG
jgi:pumilio RNA-binding family